MTKLLRMRQITGGFLVRDGGDPDKPEQVSTSKLDALKDIIEDYVIDGGKKLVVFASFIPEVKAIIDLAKKVLPRSKKAVAIYGAIKKEDRGGIVKQFQEDPNTVLFIGQIDTAGTGITLTAADTCVYYSKTYNYATYEQSLSRIHRIGQRNTCTYIDLVVEKTVDEMITKALRKKEDMAKKVEADLVLDRKMDANKYNGGDLHNYVASQELTVTITLSEYRELVSGIATKDKDISIANDDKYKREQEIREVKAANDTLKAENYDLKVIIDNLRKQIEELEKKLKTNDAANTQQADMISDLRKKLKEAQDTILYLQRNIDDITRAEKEDLNEQCTE